METEWNPGRILGLSGSYWPTCTLHAGVKLDIFSHIGDGKTTCESLAAELQVNIRALQMILNALSAMGLLKKDGAFFANSPGSKTFLCKSSGQYLGYMIMHHHHLVESWSRLDQAVKMGSPVRVRALQDEEERREAFLMGMFNNAMNIAPKLTRELDLSACKTLLDLGGGPGTYAIHFCLNNPALTATVYDLPTTRPFAEKCIDRFGLSGRIEFTEGNYVNQNLPGKYDAVWLSHILHGEGPGDCRNIVQKAASALNPGGLIMIHEFILNDDMGGPLFPALFSLNMLLGTREGQSYSEGQLKNMLAEAGAKDIRRIPVTTPNDSGVIWGRL